MPRGDRTESVLRARAALIIAARRRSLVTYRELGLAIDMTGVDLRNQLRHVLDDLSDHCSERSEPSLAALVVNSQTGAPGRGWTDDSRPWHAEMQKVFTHWTQD